MVEDLSTNLKVPGSTLHWPKSNTGVLVFDEAYFMHLTPRVIHNFPNPVRVHIRFKPIFHQNAKYLASGAGVGQCPRRQNFALGIPTCWYLKCKICITRRQIPNTKPRICVSPDAKPGRQSVEYRMCWVPTQNAGVGHVYFMFFV